MRTLKFTIIALFTLAFTSAFAPAVTHAEQSTYQAQLRATTTPVLFDQNLRLGSVNVDVLRLQKFLNAHGFAVATSGTGSIGKETVRYGSLTQKAVALFQTKYSDKILKPQNLTKPTGNFFKATRDTVNEILKEESKPKPMLSTGSRPVSVSSSVSVSTPVNTYDATVTSSSHVSVSPGSVQTVNDGGTASFTVVASTGYTRNDAVGGTCATGSWVGNVYTTGVMHAHCTISFSATINSYTVTVGSTDSATVSPSSPSTVAYGSIKKFAVTAAPGYVAGAASGTCPAGSWAHNVYTTGPITADCTVDFSNVTLSAGGGAGAGSIFASNDLYIRQRGGFVQYSLDQDNWTNAGWPMTIVNSDAGNSMLYVRFLGDFTVSDASQYFIAGSGDITFQGETSGTAYPTVFNIYNVTDYSGLIKNGDFETPGYGTVRISNVFVRSVGSTLVSDGGWVAQSYYTGGVSHSGSNGDISFGGGGIVGAYATDASVTDSYSTGSIGSMAGGLVGRLSYRVEVNTSYSTGEIGTEGGGIIGSMSSDANVSASYSTGVIGNNAGGILGSQTSNGNVTNAYSTGFIGGNAGGIVGAVSVGTSATHSYTTGSTGSGYGIYSGSGTDGSTNYSEANNSSSGWNDVNAVAVLSSVNAAWAPGYSNTPFRIRYGGQDPYSSPSETIVKGNTSSVQVYGNHYACTILRINEAAPSTVPGITMDSETGAISVSSDTPNGTYDVLVTCDSALDSHSALVHPVTVTD